MTNRNTNDVHQTVQECCTEVPKAGASCYPAGPSSSCCPTTATPSCCAGPGVAAEQIQEERAVRTVSDLNPDEVRQAVRERYAEVSKGGTSCAGDSTSCCAGQPGLSAGEMSASLGYSSQELESVPEGANMGLGCGNPAAIAALKPGETILDLGSGGGFDCFLAAEQVGENGQVVGVDMTPEMITKARANATKGGYENVDFRLGEIEHLPVADASVDVVVSNCVINLSPDKPAVYREAWRVLKPGGRIAISDVLRTAELPEKVRNDLVLFGGCVAGAASVEEVESMLREAGFEDIRVKPEDESREFIRQWGPGSKIEDYIVSATMEAVKP